jgi:hypothetical protein
VEIGSIIGFRRTQESQNVPLFTRAALPLFEFVQLSRLGQISAIHQSCDLRLYPSRSPVPFEQVVNVIEPDSAFFLLVSKL